MTTAKNRNFIYDEIAVFCFAGKKEIQKLILKYILINPFLFVGKFSLANIFKKHKISFQTRLVPLYILSFMVSLKKKRDRKRISLLSGLD